MPGAGGDADGIGASAAAEETLMLPCLRTRSTRSAVGRSSGASFSPPASPEAVRQTFHINFCSHVSSDTSRGLKPPKSAKNPIFGSRAPRPPGAPFLGHAFVD